MVIGVIMAGGKGIRMNFNGEKPLIPIRGKLMIQYVCEAIQSAMEVDDLVVATSKNTPLTTAFIRKSGLKVVETPGNGYVDDLGFVIDELQDGKVKTSDKDDIMVTITADLPLITGPILDGVIREYRNTDKPAMCVAVPLEFFKKFDLKPHMTMGDTVPSGLNILRRNNNQQDEEVLELRKFELALNINSPEDIISLEKYFEFKSFKQVIR